MKKKLRKLYIHKYHIEEEHISKKHIPNKAHSISKKLRSEKSTFLFDHNLRKYISKSDNSFLITNPTGHIPKRIN